MIQRIQTVFLFIAAILILLIIFFPYAEVLVGDGIIYSFKVYGIFLPDNGDELITSTLPLLILPIISTLIIFIAIFLFKKRLLQLRLCLISIILLLGIYGLGAFYIYKLSSEYDTTISYSFPIIIPLISAILIFMAMRAIKKDELLIKSLDRVR